MNKQRTIRYVLVAAIAAAVTMPLLAQVKNARTQEQARQQPAAAPEPAAPALPPATQPAPVDPNKVILTSGDITVTAGDFDAAVATLPPQYQAAVSQPALKKKLADRIVQIKLLAREAKQRNVEDDPKVKQQEETLKRQIDLQTDQILANALADKLAKDDVGDKAYFDANKAKFDNMKARHILIRTPDSPVPLETGKKELTEAQAKTKADQLKQRLDKGEDFATIAKAESDDKGSGAKGGDLGTFAPWTMDATFSKAAQGLQKNQISQPVKTQFGYHIIQLLDDSPRTYEQAKTEVSEARMNSLMEDLKKNGGTTTYDPGFFGTGPAANESGPTTRPAAASGSVSGQPAPKKGA